jgi:hypothetical protein
MNTEVQDLPIFQIFADDLPYDVIELIVTKTKRLEFQPVLSELTERKLGRTSYALPEQIALTPSGIHYYTQGDLMYTKKNITDPKTGVVLSSQFALIDMRGGLAQHTWTSAQPTVAN